MKTENPEEAANINKTDDSIKITITKDAEKVLSEVVKKINDDFEGGKVNRQVVASWFLQKACDAFSESDAQSIRSDNFDPTAAFAALYKRVQETGIVPAELRQILLSQVGLKASAKKSSKTKLTSESVNGVLSEQTKVA